MTADRQLDIETLRDELGRLGAFGVARVSPSHVPWLESAGVAIARAEAGSVHATSRWLAAGLPARDALDLLRKTLIRDATYRVHLDIVLASVLQAVGASGRWSRLEELLGGPCHAFAPRFVALLEWASRRAGKTPQTLDPADWDGLDPAGAGGKEVHLAAWDEHLWGFSGTPSTLFPLLQDLYCPLLAQPMAHAGQGHESEHRMLVELVTHASRSAGVKLSSDAARNTARSLMEKGLPVRIVVDVGNEKAVLVGAVECVGEDHEGIGEDAYVDALSAVAKSSRFWVRESSEPYGDFWALDRGEQLEAFVSLDANTLTWAEAEMTGVPAGAQLPRAALLRGLSSSQVSIDALRKLCDHAFFGFFVQVLLLEALDRELGQESLILAPECRVVVEDIEASTRVFYRPHASVEAPEGERPTADLGTLDATFDELAKGAGLMRVHTPYRLPGGVWSLGLRLLRSVELVRARADRWALSEHVVDRLHAGGLMTDVIRRGKAFRERLHAILAAAWQQRLAASREASHG